MHETTRAELTEALRLREAEPGLSQADLIARVSETAHGGNRGYLNPRSPVGEVVYQAYLGGIEAASHFSRTTLLGIDMTEGYDN